MKTIKDVRERSEMQVPKILQKKGKKRDRRKREVVVKYTNPENSAKVEQGGF